jgi:pteridine reductase
MSAEAFDISGKTALVTGAAKRLGRAIALALAAEGADVVVHYRSSGAQAEHLVGEIARLGRRAWALGADLADPAEVDGLFARARAAAGELDIIVNSASVFHESAMADVAPREFQLDAQVNALAPYRLIQLLAARARAGAVVNLLDARLVGYDPKHVAYVASKRTLFTLTRMAALAFAPLVRVNAVAPGLILPPPGADDAWLARVAPKENPLGAHGTARGVCDAVVFLLRAAFVTGQVVYVDGGRNVRESPYG